MRAECTICTEDTEADTSFPSTVCLWYKKLQLSSDCGWLYNYCYYRNSTVHCGVYNVAVTIRI